MNGPLRIQNELKRVAALSEYHAHGFYCCQIEPGSKGPNYQSWNTEPLQPNHVVPEGFGLGLLHSLSGTAALDVDQYEAAKTWLAERGVDLDGLLNAPDAVQIVSGRPGSNKLLFKSWLPLPSKKVVINGKTVLEFRCATVDGKSVQDLLPVEGYLHVPCGTQYQWGGQGSWEALPALPDALLTVWTALLQENSQPKVKHANETSSWNEIMSALHAIDPGCDRKTWTEVGMAMHHAGELLDSQDEAFAAWDAWSSQSAKYRQREMAGQWRSFKQKKDGITVATLFHHARLSGWVRPVIVPDGVFFAVQGPVARQPAQRTTEWPDPKPIVKSLLPVLPFDYNLLPEPFVAWVKDTAERKCWAPDFLAVALMTVAATLAGRKVALQPMDDDWRIVPNQWAGCVSPPGAAKSPAINLAVDFLQPFQAKAAEQFDTQMRWYENDREFHEAQVKALEAKRLALLKGDRNTEPDEQAARVVHAEIDKLKSDFKRKVPVLKRYVTRNATAEGLFDVFDQNPQGVLWHSDELSRLLKQMLTENFSTLRGSMLSAANGNDEDTMDRRTNGRYGITVRMCLSLVGSIQSDLLPMLLASGDDGLAQRFGLFVWPDPTRADPDAARRADDAAKAKVAEALVRLDALFPMRDKDDQILIPFDASAARDFNLWRCRLFNDIEAGLIEAPFSTYLSKLPKVLGSLALIIAMVEGDTTQVTMQAWQKARKWQPYLVSHLERIVGYARNSMEHSARSIIAKLTSKAPGSNGSIVLRHEGVLYTTARECQRMGVSGCDDSRKATDLLDWLVELGYLVGPRELGSVKRAYIINPKVGGCE